MVLFSLLSGLGSSLFLPRSVFSESLLDSFPVFLQQFVDILQQVGFPANMQNRILESSCPPCKSNCPNKNRASVKA